MAKKDFLKSPHAKQWANLSASETYRVATDAAMLEALESASSNNNDPQAAMANHFRMEGARRYRKILTELADPGETPQRTEVGQLDHNV